MKIRKLSLRTFCFKNINFIIFFLILSNVQKTASWKKNGAYSSPGWESTYSDRGGFRERDGLWRQNQRLQFLGVEVPVYKFRGEDAVIKCLYDKGKEKLYTLKWYKDDREFYRYVFQSQRPKIFLVSGINVDLRRSNDRQVVLKNLSFESTGVYKCEVSADAPKFSTFYNDSIMVVVELPKNPPKISNFKTHYEVGETASLLCTSSKSKPAARLTWFVNDREVTNASHAGAHHNYTETLYHYEPISHADELETTMLRLTLKVDDSHFRKGVITFKCRATVAAIYSASEEEGIQVIGREPYILEQKFDLIRVHSSAVKKTLKWILFLSATAITKFL